MDSSATDLVAVDRHVRSLRRCNVAKYASVVIRIVVPFHDGILGYASYNYNNRRRFGIVILLPSKVASRMICHFSSTCNSIEHSTPGRPKSQTREGT